MGNPVPESLIEQKKKAAGGKIVLNLGSGDKLWDEAINCDMPGNYSGEKPDLECDIRKLPFEDGFADEVHAIHVLEHFYFTEVEEVFKEWLRVLKPDGWLCIEVPCLEKIMGNFDNTSLYGTKEFMQLTYLGLYGDQIPGRPEMVHKWCYSTVLLKNIFLRFNLKNVEIQDPLFHIKMRDMRVVGQK